MKKKSQASPALNASRVSGGSTLRRNYDLMLYPQISSHQHSDPDKRGLKGESGSVRPTGKIIASEPHPNTGSIDRSDATVNCASLAGDGFRLFFYCWFKSRREG